MFHIGIIDKEKERIIQLLDYLILVFLAVVVWMAFQFTTMNYGLYSSWTPERIRMICVLGICIVFVRRSFDDTWSLSELAIGAFVIFAFARNWLRTYEYYIIEIAVLIIGCRKICFEKILKVYLTVVAISLLWTMMLALTGKIENLIYIEENRRTRISFGICYPTDFSAHVFFISLCYAWIRERKISWIEIILIAGAGVFCLYFCDAKTSSICIWLLAVILGIYKIIRRFRKDQSLSSLVKAIATIMCFAAPIAAVTMYLLSALFEWTPTWMAIDELINRRIAWGKVAFIQYGYFSWSGQYIPMVGNGYTTVHSADYFFIDSSYVNVLLTKGALILFIALAALVRGSLEQLKQKSWERLWILVLVAIHCVMEQHLLEIAYNPFLLLLLATTSVDPDKARVLPVIKRRAEKGAVE